MRFFTEGNLEQLIFEDPAQYPAGRPTEMMQARERTAAGTSHVETYAVPIAGRALKFDLMNDTDYQGLYNWFINIAQGMQNTFFFEDERGTIQLVRCTDRKFNFKEITYLRYTGSMNLEYINA